MSTIKRILVPTDFSEDSGYALETASEIAKRYDAEVDLLYVVPSIQHFMRYLSSELKTEYSETLNQEAEKKLRELSQKIRPENRGDRIVLFDNNAGKAVLEQIRAGDYDLVMIGSKGSDRTKLGRGSTAQHIIRGSRVPVLSVNRFLNNESVNRIMISTDGSDLSFAALSPAVIMADIWDADIVLFYVHELRGGLIENLYTSPEEIQKERIYDRLLKKLDSFMDKNKTGGLRLERGEKPYHDRILFSRDNQDIATNLITDVKTGFSSHHEIRQYAEKNADLVVMGTHGYSGFAHVMLGSVTEKVIQNLDKPVLTVRPYESDFILSERGVGEVKNQETSPIPPWHWL
ncbi:MAG: universal stress protein [Balneolaceae bacterium]|nr:universal stress protein [Balneolaceae bacterium]